MIHAYLFIRATREGNGGHGRFSSEDDLILIEEKHQTVELLDSDEEVERRGTIRALTDQTIQERQEEILNDIKKTAHNFSADEDDTDVIDGDFDDTIVNDPSELIDKKVMDDLFAEDTLLNRYQTTSTSRNTGLICLTENNIIHCPLCQDRLSRNDLAIHLEGCMGIKVEVRPVKYNVRRKSPFYKNKLDAVIEDDSDDELQNQIQPALQLNNRNLGTVCPVCNKLQQGDINAHLDLCLVVSFEG